jgi:hypothetical protein
MASIPQQPSSSWKMEPHYFERSDYTGGSVSSIGMVESHELPSLLPHNSADTQRRSPSPTAKRTKPAGVQWRRLGTWTLFFVWLSVLIYAIFVLALWDYHLRWSDRFRLNSCRPDGTFTPFTESYYTSWSPAGFFQITMGFGELSFTQAKVVDIAWDLVSVLT